MHAREILHCMIDLLHKADRGMPPCYHHHIWLKGSFRSDLRWWLVFYSQGNGVSCWFPPIMVHQVVLSDASEHGVVVLIGSSYGGHLGHR